MVVKPAISASAYETRRIKRATRQQNEWLNAMLATRPMMVQEFIPEIQSGGEWSLIFAGMEFTHAVHKRRKPEISVCRKSMADCISGVIPRNRDWQWPGNPHCSRRRRLIAAWIW